MKLKKRMIIIAASVLTVGLVWGIAAVASGNFGTKQDPLITLSYLNETLTPELLEEFDSRADAKAAEVQTLLNQKIEELTKKIEEQEAGVYSTYSVVALDAGDTITCGVGAELMLRIGSVACTAADTPGLIDMTTGGTAENGSTLTVNHMYACTIAGHGVRASEYSMVLVRGEYTVS